MANSFVGTRSYMSVSWLTSNSSIKILFVITLFKSQRGYNKNNDNNNNNGLIFIFYKTTLKLLKKLILTNSGQGVYLLKI